MVDMYEMTNGPLSYKIGDKVFKFRQISIEKLFSTFEAEVVSKDIREAQLYAEGLEPGAKAKFMQAAFLGRPKGIELFARVEEQFQTLEGVVYIVHEGLKQDQPEVDKGEVLKLISGNMGEVSSLVQWICGLSDLQEEGEVSEEEEKK